MKSQHKELRKSVNRLGRYRQYFVSGHSRWFVFIMGLSNFSLIFYNFMWINLDFVPDILKNEVVFLCLFFVIYLPLVTVFGFYDLTRGTYSAEINVALDVNPIWKRHFKEMQKIRKQNKKIIELLEN